MLNSFTDLFVHQSDKQQLVTGVYNQSHKFFRSLLSINLL